MLLVVLLAVFGYAYVAGMATGDEASAEARQGGRGMAAPTAPPSLDTAAPEPGATRYAPREREREGGDR